MRKIVVLIAALALFTTFAGADSFTGAVEEGDEALLFGEADDRSFRVEVLAEAINTIPYELLCHVSRRVPRIYSRNGKVLDA